MSYEAIGAFSALATFLVIAATAIAALVQLRHLRQSNQLSGLLSVLQLFQDPHLHELIDFVRTDLPKRMEDPVFIAGLDKIPVDRKQHPELHLAELYEEVGSFVRSGLIDENLFLQGHWYNVLLYWKLLQPPIVVVRKKRPYTFENFEYLATRAQAWHDRHPHGNYPASVPRMIGLLK
ncbi:MAG TPA: hypothetical protein VMS32_11295 [Verrucomicrobiae bacterium]|jgi:hypothetical protein|nr:hypothetical protein [Verrucomicrobiae bacterium]